MQRVLYKAYLRERASNYDGGRVPPSMFQSIFTLPQMGGHRKEENKR